jgi:RNA polymerase sigma factor (sigma-70 family)
MAVDPRVGSQNVVSAELVVNPVGQSVTVTSSVRLITETYSMPSTCKEKYDLKLAKSPTVGVPLLGSARKDGEIIRHRGKILGSLQVDDNCCRIPAVDPSDFDAVLESARSGEEWAWSRLYGEFSGSVLGYLRARGATEPEDLLLEVFLQVARNLGSFSGDLAGFRSWLFTITHRRLIDERRAQARTPIEPVPDLEPPQWGQDPAETVIDRLGTERIVRILQRLVPDQREVLLLRVIGGLTIPEIARILGKTSGAVKALQRRGLHNLKEFLPKGVPL